MTEINTTENSEKKSLNFIEQIVEKDLQEGKTAEEYRPVSRLSPTDTCTSDMQRPSAWTSELPSATAAYATCVLMTPTPPRKMWNM